MPLDFYDPYGVYASAQPVMPGVRTPINPLDQQQEDSLLSRIGGKVLGGIGYVGGSLEKAFGGRAIRGLLGGHPEELASIIPFSDAMGITDEANRVSGKELLGLQDEEGFLPALAGIGAEIATDPSSYLAGLGIGRHALTPAGKAAAAIGELPPTLAGRVGTTLSDVTTANSFKDLGRVSGVNAKLADTLAARGQNVGDLLGQRLGGIAEVGIPGMTTVVGASEGGENLINAVGNAANYVGHVSPLRKVWEPLQANVLDPLQRYSTAWFSPAVKGAVTSLGQEAGRTATETEQALHAVSSGKAHDYGLLAQQMGLEGRGGDLRQVIEGSSSPWQTPAELAGPLQPGETRLMSQQPGEQMNLLGDRIRDDYAQQLYALQERGVNVGHLVDDYIQYGRRQHIPLPGEASSGFGRAAQPLNARDPSILSREDILRNIPGGTESLNRMVQDPAVSGAARDLAAPQASAAHIRRNYLNMTPADEAQLAQLKKMDFDALRGVGNLSPQDLDALNAMEAERTALQAKVKHADDLADWLHQLSDEYAGVPLEGPGPTGLSLRSSETQPYFNQHPIQDYASYFDKTNRQLGAAEASHNLLATTLKPAGTEGTVPLMEALNAAGLGSQRANGRGGLTFLADKLGVSPADLANNFAVPESTVGELKRFMKGFSEPESVTPVLGVYDYLTRLTKTLQTAPWPGFHVRNFVTGLWQNLVKGGFEPGRDFISGFIKPYQDANALIRGESIADAHLIPGLTHLSPEEANQALLREMYSHNVLQTFNKYERGLMPAGTLEELTNTFPGEVPKTLGGAVDAFKEGSHNPLTMFTNAEQYAPVAAGREAGDLVESLNRGSLYMAKRRQGFDPASAAREVLDAHFDYNPATAMTGPERNIVKRVIPFYTFTKGNLPFQLEQLIARPGGPVALEAKIVHAAREDQGGFLPPYLGNGLALGLGQEDNGTQRFLTQLDLPSEQAFQPLSGGATPAATTAERLLGQLNPLIKGPLEFATGKQFFTDRQLADLYPSMGDFPGSRTLEQVIMNSPFGKAVTAGRTLTDPRKYESLEAASAIPLNLLTGARVSDVDVEKYRNIAARDYITQALRGMPEISNFQSLAPRPGVELTPEQTALLRLNKTLEMQAAERARLQDQRKIGVQR